MFHRYDFEIEFDFPLPDAGIAVNSFSRPVVDFAEPWYE